jgi:hypothetical protein
MSQRLEFTQHTRKPTVGEVEELCLDATHERPGRINIDTRYIIRADALGSPERTLASLTESGSHSHVGEEPAAIYRRTVTYGEWELVTTVDPTD